MTSPRARTISGHRPAGFLIAAAIAFLAASLPAQAAGVVEVRFVNPERFSDIGLRPADRQATLNSLSTFLQALGSRLPDGQTLRVDIKDIDLAGELIPFRADAVRVLRGRADWPRISLHYTLLAQDKVVTSGDADLADMDYLDSPPFDEPRLGELPFEKRLLLKWFDTTFATP